MIEQPADQEESGEQCRRVDHSARARYRPAPRIPFKGSSAFNTAAETLWPALSDYPGLLKGMAALFGNRAAKLTIRDWRRGKRKPPTWARQLLLDEIEKRIAALEHVRALMKAASEKAGD